MTPRGFRDEELNRRRHVRTLYVGLAFLVASQLLAYAGWWHASGTQRLSLPPQLRYGATLRGDEIQPWEAYVFAGYIHQQINNWTDNGAVDNLKNIRRLSSFLTPGYRSQLSREHRRHESQFRNRQRSVSPVPGSYGNESVSPLGRDAWRVVLDVRLRDYVEDQLYKDIDVRYFLEVVLLDADPETNEWGLALNRQYRPPERLRSHMSALE